MGLSRRGFVAGSLLTLAGCGGVGQGRVADAKGAFLLLPLTGAMAAVGQDMARAATLADPGAVIAAPFDTGEGVDTAAAAARQAMAAQARLLLGPLRADQVPGVLQVAGSVPVVTFSNDEGLTGSGAYILGVTPAQSVATMFSYARAQGARRVAVVASDTPFGRSTAIAAQQIAAAGGMNLSAKLLRDPGAGGLAAALRQASGGVMPEAVFVPDRGAALLSIARGLRGVQIMGGMQWGLGAEAEALTDPDLEGAWYAAPPPAAFQDFADRFEASFGSVPGYVAALGFDAAVMALTLSAAGTVSRKGIVRASGFSGALGRFRFLEDGRCKRDLSVLGLTGGRIVALGEVSDT